MVSLLFGFSGRINRAQFWIGNLIAGFGGMMLLFLMGVMLLPSGGFEKTPEGAIHAISSMGLAFGVPLGLMSWIGFALQTKRFHDRGRSGLWTMLPMLPAMMIVSHVVGGIMTHASPDSIVSGMGMWFMVLQLIQLGIFIDLGCLGSKEANKYGPAPGGGFNGGAPTGGGSTPIPGQSSKPKAQPVPGMGAAMTSAESAIERAIAARTKEAQAAAAQTPRAPQPATRPAYAPMGASPAGGSFGRKATR